jgi:lipid-binding SYLF domain-containing protein
MVKETMPDDVQPVLQGVCFSHTMRAALAIGYQHGRAFALARLEESRWNAPLYLTINKLSIGVSYGTAPQSCFLLVHTVHDQEGESVAPCLAPPDMLYDCGQLGAGVKQL